MAIAKNGGPITMKQVFSLKAAKAFRRLAYEASKLKNRRVIDSGIHRPHVMPQ
jgi:hypothetical protein